MENFSWNYLDFIFLAPLLYAAYKGYSKGIIFEAATLLALVLGLYGAYRFSDLTTEFLVNDMDMTSEYTHLISFGLTFLAIVILVHFLAKILDKIVKAVALGFINRLAGSLFRIIKLAFIISVILMLIERFDYEEKIISPPMKSESVLFEPIAKFAPMVFPYLDLEALKQKGYELEEELDDATDGFQRQDSI